MISKGETFLLRGVLRSKIVLTEFESLPVREKSYERALFRFQRIFVTDDFSKNVLRVLEKDCQSLWYSFC